MVTWKHLRLKEEDNSNIECKHCGNYAFYPSDLESLRRTMRTTKAMLSGNALQAKEDKEFEKILNGKYCCSSAQYDAEDEYKKYFPYHGMAAQQWYIDIINRNIIALAEMMRDFTPEKYGKITAEAKSKADPDERWETIRNIKVWYDKLEELAENTKCAYERETDHKRRELLDGRKKEEIK